jgi:orotate phosphoribosyltransferase
MAGRDRLLEILVDTSFRSEKEAVFRLASGRSSQYYVDCKQALSYPEARVLVGALIFDLIATEAFGAVGGLELGAYPIATAVSDAIFRKTRQTVRVFVVRKQPKTHGIRDLIAGDIMTGDRALIVDDVITTGKSTLNAIAGARAAGLCVERAVALVDREEADGKQTIEGEGVLCESLFTLADLIAAARARASY